MNKVLVINTTFDKGGAARVARDLFEHLNDDFDLFFAYGRGGKSSDKKVFKFGNRLEVFAHIFFVRFLGLEGFGSYFSTRRLIGFIESERPDLIHLHNLHGYYLNFFQLITFLKEEKIPVVWTLHDEWPITWLPAHSMGCKHCKEGIGVCTNTYKYPKNYFPLFMRYMLKKKREAFSTGWNPIFVCPSQWLKTSILESFLGGFDVRVIGNGIDTNLFKPVNNGDNIRKAYGLPLDKKIVMFSASNLNDSSKGAHYVIEVANLLKDKNYLFVGIGDGEIEHTDNIKTLGYVYDKRSFAELCSIADVYCLTSVAETFSLAAAEALSCGAPVVGFNIPVVREIVNQDVGILVEPKNGEKLANAIITLLDDDQKRIEMGQKGRALVLANYSHELFYAKYSDLYREVLK